MGSFRVIACLSPVFYLSDFSSTCKPSNKKPKFSFAASILSFMMVRGSETFPSNVVRVHSNIIPSLVFSLQYLSNSSMSGRQAEYSRHFNRLVPLRCNAPIDSLIPAFSGTCKPGAINKRAFIIHSSESHALIREIRNTSVFSPSWIETSLL